MLNKLINKQITDKEICVHLFLLLEINMIHSNKWKKDWKAQFSVLQFTAPQTDSNKLLKTWWKTHLKQHSCVEQMESPAVTFRRVEITSI